MVLAREAGETNAIPSSKTFIGVFGRIVIDTVAYSTARLFTLRAPSSEKGPPASVLISMTERDGPCWRCSLLLLLVQELYHQLQQHHCQHEALVIHVVFGQYEFYRGRTIYLSPVAPYVSGIRDD